MILAAFSLFQDVNPDDGLVAIPHLIANLINFAMFSVGALSIIFLVVGGIRMSTSAGNPKSIAAARKTITYAIVGLVLALSSVVILNFVQGYFK